MSPISDEELVKISASAFLDLVLHVFRFWSTEPQGEKRIVFGLLLGRIEDHTRLIRKVQPILHQKTSDLNMDEEFMKMVGTVNKIELDAGSVYEVIGWYRTEKRSIKFKARDIKNHIKFQKFNSKFIGLIFSPEKYLQPDEYGFSVFRLKGEKYYNMMSDYYKIPWEIETVEDAQKIISNFKRYIRSYFIDKPLITEFKEISNTDDS